MNGLPHVLEKRWIQLSPGGRNSFASRELRAAVQVPARSVIRAEPLPAH